MFDPTCYQRLFSAGITQFWVLLQNAVHCSWFYLQESLQTLSVHRSVPISLNTDTSNYSRQVVPIGYFCQFCGKPFRYLFLFEMMTCLPCRLSLKCGHLVEWKSLFAHCGHPTSLWVMWASYQFVDNVGTLSICCHLLGECWYFSKSYQPFFYGNFQGNLKDTNFCFCFSLKI